MVADNLYGVCVAFFPYETNAPLVVDTNAMLALSVAGQFFQMIGWRIAQVLQRFRCIQDFQFAPRRAVLCSGREHLGDIMASYQRRMIGNPILNTSDEGNIV